MVSRGEYEALGIKTPEGKRIYRRCIERAGNLQDLAAKAKSRKEFRRIDMQRQQLLIDCVKEALALNKAPRKKKRTAKRYPLRRAKR